MSEEFKLDMLQLHFLPAKGPGPTCLARYNEVYGHWRDLWSKTFEQEFNDGNFLYSNEFTRQDEVVALYYDGELAGLCCLRAVDFNEISTEHDSYFKKWPEITLHKLLKHGKRILICSQLTVTPAFRKNRLGISWKDLLVAVSARRLLETGCDAMVGAVRRMRGMEKATYRSGFIPLAQDLPYLGQESVDLVAYLRKKASPSAVSLIAHTVETIFPLAIHYGQTPYEEKEVKHAA